MCLQHRGSARFSCGVDIRVALLPLTLLLQTFHRHESGVHRVQRVPATETMGRVHTSTASVVVLPDADQVHKCA